MWSTNGPDNEGNDCWLLSDVPSTHLDPNRVFGWIGTPPPLPPPPPPQYTFTLGASSGASYYGAGGGAGDSRSLTFTSSNPVVGNTHFYAPLYYSSDGYGALAVSDLMYDPNNLPSYPAGWSSQSSAVEWAVKGSRADLYLMPGTHPTAHSSLWDLIGRPAIPPRYAFGFIACRWGWGGDGGGGGRSYIWKTLSAFRQGNFPIDAWISDFGWYTAKNDYDLPETGSPTFQDFSYNSDGPEATFPQPVEQLQQYHDTLHMRFGGIRKPRLGNSKLLEMAYSKRWTVGQPSMTGMLGDGGPRNLNYSIEAVRTWYAEQQQHYHSDGVDFWWNDEGEIFYFDFFWWNTAQRDGLHKYNSSKRFWSINRAYTPGISRLGAVIWTGDIPVSWDSLANQPGYILNWHMAGAGFITCDTGGFNGGDTSGLLLTRWYQYAALMPVMRVHSTKANVPHFPFLYSPDAADAMRKAMNLRYELLPYHYSLAHHAYAEGGIPMMRPLLWYFPSDPKVAEMTFQWMDGDKLMAAPVLQQDNSTSVYLPKAQWYEFNSTVVHTGPTTLSLENVPLDHIPMYAQAGAVLPLTSSAIQHTGELPGGPLLLQIYGGADGSFVLVEDDGETMDYTTGAVKRTSFTWSESSRTLSWTTQGTLQGAWSFLSVSVVLFEEAGVHSQTATLTATGHVKF